MDETVTEKKYPIRGIWVLKSIMLLLPIVIIMALLLIFSIINNTSAGLNFSSFLYLGIGIFLCVLPPLQRRTFHYSIEDRFLTLKQGILSRQQKHIPYGVIQNIFIKQDLFDRIFGLASLSIENASQGAGILITNQQRRKTGEQEMIGFLGNKVSIPGLRKQDAETLKEIVLQKMKENPIEDSQSGL